MKAPSKRATAVGLAVCAVIGLVVALLWRPVVGRAARQLAESRLEQALPGSVAEVSKPRVSLSGTVHIDRISVSADGLEAVCTGLTLHIRPGSVLRGDGYVRRAGVEECRARVIEGAETEVSNTEETSVESVLARAWSALEKLGDTVGRLRIDAAAAEHPRYGSLSGADIRFDRRDASLRAELSADVSGERIAGSLNARHATRRAELQLAEAIEVEEHGATATCRVLIAGADYVGCSELALTATHGARSFSGTIAEAQLRGTLSAPAPMAVGGELHVELGDAPGVGDFTDPGLSLSESRPRYGPIRWIASHPVRSQRRWAERDPEETDHDLYPVGEEVRVRLLQRAHAGLARLFNLSIDAGDLPVLRARDIAIHVEDEELRIVSAAFSSGRFLEVETEGTFGALGARVRTGDSLSMTLTGTGVDLSELGQRAGVPMQPSGSADFELHATMDHAAAISVDGTWSTTDAAMTPNGLEDNRMEHLDTQGTFRATLSTEDAGSAEFSGSARVGQHGQATETHMPWTFAGDMLEVTHPRDGQPAVRLRVSGGLTQQTECRNIWNNLPDGLIADIGRNGMTFEGGITPQLRAEYRIGEPESFVLNVAGVPETCRITWITPRFDPEQLNDPDFLHHVTEGVTEDDVFCGPGYRSWIRQELLPRHVTSIMVSSEESGFYQNHGVSLTLINKAIRRSIGSGHLSYGGSTISQQLVKNLFFTRTKSLSRKFQELLVSWAMEERVTKFRILEMYLNCIEFGRNIWGIVDASFIYFGKHPTDMTPAEAAFLASLKPSPHRGMQYLRDGTINRLRARERMQTLINRAERGGHVGGGETGADSVEFRE